MEQVGLSSEISPKVCLHFIVNAADRSCGFEREAFSRREQEQAQLCQVLRVFCGYQSLYSGF